MARDEIAQLIAALGIEHGKQQLHEDFPFMTGAVERPPDAMQLRSHELVMQVPCSGREIEKALAAISQAFLLNDVPALDQFAQHAAKRLLGDLQYVEKLGNAHAGIAADEMQDAVMSAAKAQAAQNGIGVAGEIA